ncbi:MAG: DUF188 domain-containing protein [Spirochaetota bacterium]
MTVWADGDSLPAELRRMIERRAAIEVERARTGTKAIECRLVYVASRPIRIEAPAELILVESGADAADDRMVELSSPGDLAITRDLPLAERLAEKGLSVLNDRGDVFTRETVKERRSLRDGAVELRALGLIPESPRRRSYGPRELKDFANAFDRELTRMLRTATA